MKKVILLSVVLFLINPFRTSAQNLFTQLKTDSKILYSPSGKAGRDGHFSLAFYHNSSRNFYTFDPQGNIVTSLVQTFPGREHHQEPIAVKETADAFIYYFESPTYKNRLEAFLLGKKKSHLSFGSIMLTDNRREKLLHTVEDRKELYFLLMNKREQKLILLKAVDEKTVERKEFLLSERVFDLFRKSDFVQVYSGRENNFSGLHPDKVYLTSPNTLVLTKELKEGKAGIASGSSIILSLDFISGTSSFQVLPAAFSAGSLSANSFLLKDRMYKISGNRDFIDLSIYQFPSLAKLNEFTYSRNQEIGLMGAGLNYRKGNDAPVLIEKNNTRKILRKLQKGTLAVYAMPLNKNAVALRIGSFDELSGGGGSMMLPMGGGSISTPMGSASLPVTFHSVYFGPGRSNTQEYYFDVLLSEQFEIAGHSAPPSLQEKEENMIEKLDSRRNNYLLSLPVSFTSGLMLFYDKRDEQLNIYSLGLSRSSLPAEEAATGF